MKLLSPSLSKLYPFTFVSFFMQIMGYKSYAEFAVHPNMAASPDVVMPFLIDLSTMIRPKAEQVLHLTFILCMRTVNSFPSLNLLLLLFLCIILWESFPFQEFNAIRDFKRKMCDEKNGDLEPWDEAYFTGMMKSSVFNLDSSVSSNPA